jgi:hypothetical protein
LQVGVAWSGSGGLDPAGGLVAGPGKSRPTTPVPGGGVPGHVGTGSATTRRSRANPRDGADQVPEPVKGCDHHLDPVGQFLDRRGVLLDQVQVHPGQERVVLGEPAGQCLGQGRDFRPESEPVWDIQASNLARIAAGAVAQGHHAVLLSMTRSRTSTTVSPPALSRRLTANALSTPSGRPRPEAGTCVGVRASPRGPQHRIPRPRPRRVRARCGPRPCSRPRALGPPSD